MPNSDNAERAWSFYEHDVYEASYLTEHGLFSETRERYNPVPKIVFIMSALTLQQTVDLEGIGEVDVEPIEDFWEDNEFQTKKYQMLLWLLLNRRAVVELVRQDEGVTVVVHDPESVEIKRVGGQIAYAKIEGTTESWNAEEMVFEEIEVTKEYYNVDGYRQIRETIDGDEEERPLAFEFIPVIEFTTDYNLWPIFEKVDTHNEISAFLRAVFHIHGDPIIWDTLSGKQMSTDTKDKMADSRGKAMKMLHLGPDGTMGYLEMQGNIAKLMQAEKASIEENISNDYPEYKLADVLKEGSPSGEALKVKAIEVEAKINSLRSDVEQGVMQLNNMALEMMGRTPIEHQLRFGGVLPTDLTGLVEMLEKLRGIRLITKETAMDQIPEIIPDTEAELNGLQEEEDQIRQDIAGEFDSHVDTQDRE